ncbi:MAG: MATE family efflux transporter [Bacteroidales bacterium]|nr:MATE family efflux transporter [Bacteroidales bacterium]
MHDNIDRSIWRLTWPNALSNLTVPLLGMADVAIAGIAGGDALIGAVAVGTAIFNFIYMNCGFLRMSTTGLTAQAYGASNISQAFQVLFRALFLAFSLSFIIILLKLPIASLAIHAMGVSDNLLSLVSRYVSIRLWAIPAAIPLFALNGWFVGMQNARTPLLISLVANSVNIFLSALFTLRFNMNVEGIALGTVASQYVSLLLFCLKLSRDYPSHLSSFFSPSFFRQAVNARLMLSFFKINSNVFLRNICITLTYTLFTRFSASFSPAVLATNTLLMQFFTFYSYLFDGCAYAAEALSGKFIGARSSHLFRLAFRHLFLWGAAISFLFIFFYLLFWPQLLSLFSPSPDVYSIASHCIFYVIAVPAVGCIPYMADGILFGATIIRPLTISSAISTILFVISYFLLSPFFGNDGLWIAFIIFTLSRGLLLICPLKSLYQKNY